MTSDELRLVFSLRRMPQEYEDVERLSLKLTYAVTVIFGFALLPRHYIAWSFSVVGAAVVGRVIGFTLHGRTAAQSSKGKAQPSGYVFSVLFILAAAAVLVPTIYWALTTQESVFKMESLVFAVTLIWAIGRVTARFVLGVAAISISVTSLIFYFTSFQVGFLLPAGYAALVAWALLHRERRAVEGHVSA